MKVVSFILFSFLVFFSTTCKKEFSNQFIQESAMTDYSNNNNNHLEVYFLLKDQKIIPAQKPFPEDFYIVGKIIDGEFVPKSKIRGSGDLSTQGRKGWLELQSKQFFPEESARRAITPFVKGFMTESGFVPSTRDIANSP